MKKNETGRSMVEMLGVLAIIGVLSVAGIAGYTIAMRSYRANEIANGVSMLYTAVRTRNNGAGPESTDSAIAYTSVFSGSTNPGGATTLQYVPSEGKVAVTVGSNADCLALQDKIGTSSSALMHVSPAADQCGNGSSLKVSFSN